MGWVRCTGAYSGGGQGGVIPAPPIRFSGQCPLPFIWIRREKGKRGEYGKKRLKKGRIVTYFPNCCQFYNPGRNFGIRPVDNIYS